MQIPVILQFKRKGRFSDHEHIGFQRLVAFITHFTIDLCDQRRCSAIEEETAVDSRDKVREFLLDRFVHHIDHEGVHGGIDHQFAFHIFIDCHRGNADSQQHNSRKQHKNHFLHIYFSFVIELHPLFVYFIIFPHFFNSRDFSRFPVYDDRMDPSHFMIQ